MSIQRAIERAIATAKEKAKDEEAGRVVAAASAPAIQAAVSAPAAQKRQRQAFPKALLNTSDFQRVDFDPQRCIDSRILIPGGDPALETRGAAPYRMLRTRLLHRARTNGWTAIGFTSPGPSEGKSLTTLNLALSMAREMNNNVFLVDLDLRNPSIAKYLGVTPPKSIAALMSGEVAPDQALFSIGVDNLLIAASDASTHHSSELVAAGRHMDLFSYISSIASQPLILVDLPPVLSTDEAMVVAPQLDAIFLVVSEGVTRRDGLARAVDLLGEFNLAGIIMNQSHGVGQSYYSGTYNES